MLKKYGFSKDDEYTLLGCVEQQELNIMRKICESNPKFSEIDKNNGKSELKDLEFAKIKIDLKRFAQHQRYVFIVFKLFL